MNKMKKIQALWLVTMSIVGLGVLSWISTINFLLFHSFVEAFSIIIGVGVFMIGWNSIKFSKNYFLLFLGISTLFVGLLDFVHMLSYKGMAVFPHNEANTPTQLWIAARYLQCISYAVSIVFIRRKFRPYVIMGAYVLITVVLLLMIFYWHIFPDAFIEGIGLTSFKIYSEYIISTILLLSMLLLYKNRAAFSRSVFVWLMITGVTTIMSELAFTFYVSVYGASNVIGHVFKVVAVYGLYRAVIEASLITPYELLFREIKESEEKYINLYERLKITNKIMRHDILGKLTNVRMLLEVSGLSKKDRNISDAYESASDGVRIIDKMRQLERAADTGGKLEEMDLRKILEEVSLNAGIKVNIKGNGKATVDDAISSVFENLIRNARIHGEVKDVDIDIEQGNSTVIIRVKDRGHGIPKSARRQIFREGFTSGKTGHTGLGLYIVKKTIKRYNGLIHFRPNNPRGSIFIIELPKK